MNFQQILTKVIERKDLTRLEAEVLMEELMHGKLSSAQIAAVLIALRMKGECVDEIVGFVGVMRKHMVKLNPKGLAIDTCGTGGDGKGTFNISTAVALVVAGCGVKVAKHGNRGASSNCGSADVLEALGVNINVNANQAEKLLKEVGIAFLFAPLFHPTMKQVALVRRELKIRTIFNYLGPLANPAGVKRQIIGVPTKAIAKTLAEVAKKLHYNHVLLVTSEDGLDEMSIAAPTYCIEVKGKRVKESMIEPKTFGFHYSSVATIGGGDAYKNAQIIQSVLSGQKGATRDIVLLNSAAVLYIAGKVKTMIDGLKLAQESIDKGKAKLLLKHLVTLSEQNL